MLELVFLILWRLSPLTYGAGKRQTGRDETCWSFSERGDGTQPAHTTPQWSHPAANTVAALCTVVAERQFNISYNSLPLPTPAQVLELVFIYFLFVTAPRPSDSFSAASQVPFEKHGSDQPSPVISARSPMHTAFNEAALKVPTAAN